MDEYVDPVVAKLIEKFNDEGPSELANKYYYGDVLLVPKEDLPIVTVAKDATRIGGVSNREDAHTIPLVINVIVDWTRDLDQSFNLQAGLQQLYKLCEERESDYTLKTETLAYVLRKYQKLDTNLWLAIGADQTVDIDYGLGIERRGPNIFSVEAVIRLNAVLHIAKPSS